MNPLTDRANLGVCFLLLKVVVVVVASINLFGNFIVISATEMIERSPDEQS